MDVQTLADVLALKAGDLTLDHAIVTVSPERAVISSPAQVLGRTGYVSLVITPGPDGLVTTVGAGLSDVRFTDMVALGWIDPSVDTDRLPDVVFPTVDIAAGEDLGHVVIQAPLPGSAVLSGAPFALQGAALHLELLTGGTGVLPLSAEIRAAAGISSTAVRMALPAGLNGWRLGLAPGAQKSFSSLAADLDAFTGVGFSSILPASLPGGFSITALDCEISPEDASLHEVQATISTTEPWSLIQGVLALDLATLRLRGRHYPAFLQPDAGWSTTGSLDVALSVFDVPVQAHADLGSSVLTLAAQPQLVLPGIGALAGKISSLMGGTDFASALPDALTNFASLSIDALSIEVDMSGPTLSAATVTVSKPEDVDWTFPYLPGLTVITAVVAIRAASPLDAANRTLTGGAVVTASVGNAEMVLSLERPVDSAICSLSLVSSDGVAMPDLLSVVGLNADAFNAALPPSLSIISDFGLDQLDVDYDLDESRAVRIAIGMSLEDVWRVIPDHLEISTLCLNVAIDRPTAQAADEVLSVDLYGEFDLQDAHFWIQAVKGPSVGGWLLRGGLIAGETLSLTDMAGALLPAGLTLPSSFPTVSLDAATFQIAPATLATKGSFTTSAHWAPTIVGKPGDMAQMSLALTIDAKADDGTRPYKLLVSGQLAIAPLPTLAAVCMTGSGSTDTEILATVTAADLQTMTVDAVATAFAGGGLSAAPAPQGFTAPEFSSAALYVDVTNPCLVLFGQSARLGTGALIVREVPVPQGQPAQWGAALVLSTAPGFTFAQILPDAADGALKSIFQAIDGIIQVEEASLSLSTFDVPAGDQNPFAAIGRLATAAAALPTQVPLPTLPVTTKVGRGLNLDAKLKISTDSFWQGFKYVVETRADSAIRLHATFDAATPGATRFEATLGGFTILQTLTFDTVHMVYVPNATAAAASSSSSGSPPATTTAPTLTLTCSGSISIPTFAAPAQAGGQDTSDSTLLTFTGDLNVTTTGAAATFTAQAGAKLRRPLGIPGIEVNSVGLAVNYAFGTDSGGQATRTLTRFAAQGSITLGSVVDLQAAVLFISGTPQIVLVELTKPVTLNDVFNQCIGTDAFNALPTLTFTSGRLYYARTAVAAAGTEPAYVQGFHLSAGVKLFDVDFTASLDVVEADGVRGTAATAHSLDWGFVIITGPTGGDSGPGVSVAALKSDGNRELALLFGFRLFSLDFINGKLAYQTGGTAGEPTYIGSIAYSGDTPLGKDPSLSIKWTKSGGFEVTNWPAELPIKNLTTLFNLASAESPCGALTALGLGDDFVQGKCGADVTLSAGPPKQNSDGTTTPTAKVDVDLRYLVSIPNPDSSKPRIVLNPNVTPVRVSVVVEAPRDATLSSLAATLTGAAESALTGVLKAILNDPAAMVTFVGTIAAVQGLQHVANDAINSLICRDIDEPNLKNEYRSRHPDDAPDDNPGDDGDEADRALKKAKDLADAAKNAKRIADAIEAAGQILAAAAAITGFFASIIAAIVHLFGGKTAEEKRRDRMLEEVDRQKAIADAAIRARLAVHNLTAAYGGNGALHVAWDAVGENDVRYNPAVSLPGGSGVYPTGGPTPFGQSGTSADYQNAGIAPGVTVNVAVAASIGGSGGIGPSLSPSWTGAPTLITFTVDDYGPHALTAEMIEGALNLSWTSGPKAATGWTITGVVPTEMTTQPLSATLAADARSWTTQALAADKIYAVVVAPAGATYPDLPAAVLVATTSQPAPTAVAGSYDAESAQLTVSWASSGAATAFKIEVRSQGSTTSLSAAADARSVVAPNAPAGGACSFRVGAVGASVTGPAGVLEPVNWSAWLDFAPAVPAAPEIASLVYRNPDVRAEWPGEPGVPAYDAQLSPDTAQPDGWVTGTVSAGAAGFTGAFSGTFVAGKTVGARARGRTTVAAGPWGGIGSVTSPSQLLLVDVPAPSAFAAVNHDDKVALSWSPPAGTAPDAYEVTMCSAAGVPLSPQPPQAAGDVPTAMDLDAQALEDGSAYRLELRARIGRCFSPAVPIDLTRAPEHPGEFLSLHNTLTPAAEGGDAASVTLAASILQPAGEAAISVAAGQTQPLSPRRVAQAAIVRSEARENAPSRLTRALATVSAVGGRATLAWDALLAGPVPSGITVAITRGLRLSAGDVWSDQPRIAVANAIVAHGVGDRDQLAELLLDVYPDLSPADLAITLAALGDGHQSVAQTLFMARGRMTGDSGVRLAAVAQTFTTGRDRPSPLTLAAELSAAEGGLTDLALSSAILSGYAGVGAAAASLAAFALQARSVPQSDAMTILQTATGDAAAAMAATTDAFGDAETQARRLLPILAGLGFDAPTALGLVPALPDEAKRVSALWAAYPSLSLFKLVQLGRGADDLAEALKAALTAMPSDPPTVGEALRALSPPASELSVLAPAPESQLWFVAKEIRDAYSPTTLQLAMAVAVGPQGVDQALLLAPVMTGSGAPATEIRAAFAEMYPWMTSAELDHASGLGD